MRSRIERLQALLAEPLLVSHPVNVRYLSGFSSSNAALLVEADRATLFTDFRYAEGARRLRRVELVETRRDLYADLADRLSGRRIGFEPDALTYARYRLLADAGIELISRPGLVEGLRRVKDEAELAAVRRAAAITSEAFRRLAEEPFVGRSERELAWRMVEILRSLGAEDVAFPVTVASGDVSASPHAVPGDRRIEAGEVVIVDAGGRAGGYCSDCARTFATGAVPHELVAAHAAVVGALEAALAALRPGAEAAAVDRVAREQVDRAGLGERFGHGLGHGVGLEVHEEPLLHPDYPEAGVLEPGNVVTLEPGVYLPGVGGVRVEDLVLVSEEGAEVLTPLPRELIRVE